MDQHTDVVVIGGGASGMVAAIAAAERGEQVLLLERSDRLGKKLLATGNGRCNLMNRGALQYIGDSTFAHQVLSHFPPEEQERFWGKYGLTLRTETEDRVYPRTLQAASVLDTLKLALDMHHVRVLLKEEAVSIRRDHDSYRIGTRQSVFSAKRVIVSAGGLAQPKLGGTDQGYHLLSDLGLKMSPLMPTLTPMETDTRSISGLQGIRVRCRVSILDAAEKCLHQEQGELLFTTDGVSGICVMQCSSYVLQGGQILSLDLLDGFTESELTDEFNRRRVFFANQPPTQLLNGMLLPKLSFAVCKQAGLALRGESIENLTEPEIQRVIRCARDYRLAIRGVKGFDHAQVTAGGIACEELYPKNLECRRIPGLHITGELLDVTGACGGYNLMFAFASGYLAGRNERMRGGDEGCEREI